MSGFADVMNGAGDVTITINGVAVTVPGQKSLAKKGLTRYHQSERVNHCAVNCAGRDGIKNPFGSVGGSFCQGNDARLDTIDGKSGGVIAGSVKSGGTSPAAHLPTAQQPTQNRGSRFRTVFMPGLIFRCMRRLSRVTARTG
jgi:hypothetical protein